MRLEEALAEARRDSGGTPIDAMVAVLRKWFCGGYPTSPGRPHDRQGMRGTRKILRAYASMEGRTWSVTGSAASER